MKKILFIAKDGFPIEKRMGRPIQNFIRILLLTRKVQTYLNWKKETGVSISFE